MKRFIVVINISPITVEVVAENGLEALKQVDMHEEVYSALDTDNIILEGSVRLPLSEES